MLARLCLQGVAGAIGQYLDPLALVGHVLDDQLVVPMWRSALPCPAGSGRSQAE
jgi:hypothetical protein